MSERIPTLPAAAGRTSGPAAVLIPAATPPEAAPALPTESRSGSPAPTGPHSGPTPAVLLATATTSELTGAAAAGAAAAVEAAPTPEAVSAPPAVPSPTPTPDVPALQTDGCEETRSSCSPVTFGPHPRPSAALHAVGTAPEVSGAASRPAAAAALSSQTPAPKAEATALRTNRHGGSRSGSPAPVDPRPEASGVSSGATAPGTPNPPPLVPPAPLAPLAPLASAPQQSGQEGRRSGSPRPILPRPRPAADILLEAITSAVSAAAAATAAAATAAAAMTAAAAAAVKAAAAASPPAPAPGSGGQGGSRKPGSLVPILPRPDLEGLSALAAAEVGRGLDPLGGAKRGKRGRHSSYNKRCAKCNCKEEDSRKRFRLCGDRPDCRRWVHKSHCLREFNTFELPSERCCRHQDVSKSACCCIACRARRRKSQTVSPGGAEAAGCEGVARRRGNEEKRGQARRAADGEKGVAATAGA